MTVHEVMRTWENEQSQQLAVRMAEEFKRHLKEKHAAGCEPCRIFLRTLMEPHAVVALPDEAPVG